MGNKDGSLTPEGERHILSSKKNLRKAFKEAAKANWKAKGESANIYTGTSSTGKNYERVYKNFINDRLKYEDWLVKKYEKIDALFEDDYDKWQEAETSFLNDPSYRSGLDKVNRAYVSKLNRAKLQDIGIKDFTTGEKAMKEYGLAYYVDDKGDLRYGKYEYL